MGGQLFKNITRRYSKNEYDTLKIEIISELKNIWNTEFYICDSYRNKKSFGDMDIQVLNNNTLDNIKYKLQTYFNTENVNCNGNVYSFVYKEFQIDLILHTNENYEFAKFWFSYDPCSNLIGKICHKLGLKYGFQGLVYPYRGFSGSVVTDILISQDSRKIFDFLGFDYDRYLKGFETLNDIFDYVVNSKYFDYTNYNAENMNHTDRKRNRKRATFQEFLKYLEDNGITKTYDWKPRIEYLVDVDKFFPECKFTEQIETLNEKNRKAKIVSEKFNGKMIMDWTAESGTKIGNIIAEFQKYVDNYVMVGNFKSWVYESDIEDIELSFKRWYKYKYCNVEPITHEEHNIVENLNMTEYERIEFSMRESTFHMNDEQAKVVIDQFIEHYPSLLTVHDIDWYYKYC
jgi:hypothetical protein